ncbi:MAG: efflux RND transporter permease subunit, partial [Burkholderiaceae bacterium]|nr:efflux RND transporter permease subunit [Burkholderiaceae bacterium]
MKPEDLGRSWVRSSSGTMIPMSTLVSWERTSGSESLARMNGYLAARFMGQAIPGVSSGDAIAEVERIAAEVLPAGYAIGWVAQAFQEKRLGSSAAMAVIFGIVMVFLILAAQYERWSLPIAVVLAVPFSALGALLTTYFTGHSNDIYFQIGLLVLIGLTAKNAILIVEFAAQKLEAGKSVFDAALEAASLRFRPILMTSLAFILGVIPLALATGPGAAARQSMGTGVVGGMIVATFIATVFVPVFFTWFVSKNVKKREDEDEDLKSPFLKHEEKEE